MSAFARALRERIALDGPIGVERYMAECNAHYYATRDPFGAGGDFTTAPEISQMFGELVGLWCVAVWQAMGRPPLLRLIELGPGRGTLIADALRAARVAPDFAAAARLHLVETSPVLRERQRSSLAGAAQPVSWHDALEEVPEGAAIVVANEFFDALPVRQFAATAEGWRERLVGLDGDRLVFGLAATAEPRLALPSRAGAMLEWPGAALAAAEAIADRLVRVGGAALAIDYGSAGPGGGDTLQAVRRHRFADPLADPGEADLTVQVDFHRLGAAAAARGAAVHGPVPQADFLEALGLWERAAALKRAATPAQADAVDAAAARLTGRGGTAMGTLFKVLGLAAGPGLASLPGLPSGPSQREN